MKTVAITSLMIIFLISGCSITPEKEKTNMSKFEKEQLKTKNDTMELLAKASLLAAKAKSVLAKTEQAYYQPLLDADQIRQMRHQNDYIPRGMEKMLMLSWAAAPEPVLWRLSAASGYELFFENQQPPIPEDVYITSEPKNIKTLLNIVEQQTDGYIKDIQIIDTFDSKKILVIYEMF